MSKNTRKSRKFVNKANPETSNRLDAGKNNRFKNRPSIFQLLDRWLLEMKQDTCEWSSSQVE